ncbi:MAG: hypothetical protein ABSF52_16560 [Syntrophobacteraceae bacterium]|jgi:hypothetical protein
MNIEKVTPWLMGSYMYEEGNRQIELSRVAGGLVLPLGRNFGYGVLAAQERFQHVGFSSRAIHTLAEIEEYDTDILIRRCLDLSNRLQVRHWYGNTLSDTNMAILSTFNREQRSKGHPEFTLSAPPLLKRNNAADCFAYAIRRIQERRTMGRSTLDLVATPKIPAALLQVPPELADGKEIEKYPAVAALSFLVAAWDFYNMDKTGPEQTSTAHDGPLFWADRQRKGKYGSTSR